jgi:hypothetical protein
MSSLDTTKEELHAKFVDFLKKHDYITVKGTQPISDFFFNLYQEDSPTQSRELPTKVKNVYYDENAGGHYSSGLILELQDGTFLRHGTIDPVKPFEKFDYLKSKEGDNPQPPLEEKKWLDRTFNEGMGTIAETVKVPYDTSPTHKDWEEWKQNFLQHLSKWSYYTADEELEKAKRFLLSSQKESIVRKVKEWEKNYEENAIVTFDKTEVIENKKIANVLNKLSASLERDNLE